MLESWFLVNGILFLLWGFISWVDVITHNLDPEPVYQSWNMFTLLIALF